MVGLGTFLLRQERQGRMVFQGWRWHTIAKRRAPYFLDLNTMKKLDDTSWHLDSEEFYAGLPEENAATHIGFFVAWAINKGLWGAIPGTDWTAAVQRVRERTITGRAFLLEECDGKLFPAMLTNEGCAFANRYYPRTYIKDYYNTLVVGLASGYLVADNWENYERIAKVIELHYAKAKARPWWKPW